MALWYEIAEKENAESALWTNISKVKNFWTDFYTLFDQLRSFDKFVKISIIR